MIRSLCEVAKYTDDDETKHTSHLIIIDDLLSVAKSFKQVLLVHSFVL